MRDPNRLDNFYDEFKKVHKEEFCDWRFGQLISNFFGWALGNNKISDIWFPEEKQWIDLLHEYVSSLKEKKDAEDSEV